MHRIRLLIAMAALTGVLSNCAAAIELNATFDPGALPSNFGWNPGGSVSPVGNVAGGVWTQNRSAGQTSVWSGGAAAASTVIGPIIHGWSDIQVTNFGGGGNDDRTAFGLARGIDQLAPGSVYGFLLYFNNLEYRAIGSGVNLGTPVSNIDGAKHRYGWEFNQATRNLKLFFDDAQVADSILTGNLFGESLTYFGDGTGGSAHHERWHEVVVAEGSYPTPPPDPPGPDSDSITRNRTWQAFRPFTQTAWTTHDTTSASNEVDVPYFLGSGLNTVWDGVRSGSSSWQHPNSHGLPTLLMAYQAEQPDLSGFISDFNVARNVFHSNLIGVNLGDEVQLVFGQGGLEHGREIRDWIVTNPDPTISSLVLLSSNPGGDSIVDNATLQGQWNNTLQTSRPDVWLSQMYPFTGAGLLASYYRSLQWYRDWSRNNGVAMWVYPQAWGSSQSAVPSESELRLQRFTSLAYGVQGFADFLWNSGPGSPSIPGAGYSDGNGALTNPTPMYQQLAPINDEIANLAQSLIRLSHTRAYHSDGQAGVFQFSSSDADLPIQQRRSGDLKNVTSNNGNQVMTGFFHDPAGEEYYLVVNKRSAENLTGTQQSSFVTLTFDPSVTAIRRLRRSDGTLETIPIGPGKTYTYLLTGGTGDLFKFDNGVPFMGIERLHYENFEGPYGKPTPEALSVIDPTWTTGGVSSLFGATGSLLVSNAVGVGGSRGAHEGTGGGLRGNERRIPDGPLFDEAALVILAGDLSFNTPLEDLGSGQFANLLLASDAADGHSPLVNFQASNGDLTIEASSLGGLPAQVSLSNGAGVSGDEFHLLLQVDLQEKRLRASVSGDASLTTGWLSYTGDFMPAQFGIVAGRFGGLSGTTWDNVSVTSLAALIGDLSGDGFIGQDDLNIVLGNWGQNVMAGNWKMGDSNGDGFVGQDDLNDVLGGWGQGAIGAVAGSTHAVPEPHAILLGAIAAAMCLVYQRHGLCVRNQNGNQKMGESEKAR